MFALRLVVLIVLVSSLVTFAACGGSESFVPSSGDVASGRDAAVVADLASEAACSVLFGQPNEKTGLSEAQCQPLCDCEGRRFVPPDYDEADIAALEAMVHLEPYEALTEDPYVDPQLPELPPETVCAVRLDATQEGAYRLQSYDSPELAEADGAQVSHRGACGLCSPLVNLAVYMRQPDLTDPVRQCALEGIAQGEEHQMDCLRALGFDEPCASIWFYNSRYTQQKCGAICMAQLDAPYHNEDGSLNECLQCDEDEAGPIFKHYAGRTRRNTGLPSSMCRPCDEVIAVVHRY